MKFCTECGSKLAGGEKFCSQCGSALMAHVRETLVGSSRVRETTIDAPVEEYFSGKSVEADRIDSVSETMAVPDSIRSQAISSSKGPSRKGDESFRMKLARTFVKSLIAPVIILAPGLLLHLSSYHIESTAWMLLGTVTVFALSYRRPWNVHWSSTLLSGLAISATYVVVNHQMAYVRPPFFGVLFFLCVWGPFLFGIAAGLYFGAKAELSADKSGQVRTAGLFFPILLWGASLSALTMSLTIVDVPLTVTFICYMAWLFTTSGLAMIFLTLFVRRYVFTKSWRLALAMSILLGVLFAIPSSGLAQGFSEGEKQAFLQQEVPALMVAMGEWFNQRRWRAAPAGLKGALNHNTPKMNYPNALGYQFSIEVGDQEDTPNWSGAAIRALVLKYRSEREASTSAKNMVTNLMSSYSSGGKLHSVRTERVDVSPNSVWVIGSWNLPSGRETDQFTIVFSFGNYAVQISEARSASDLKKKKHIGLAQAVKYAIEQRGARDSGAGADLGGGGQASGPASGQVAVPPRSTSGGSVPLDNDVISGRSLGGGPTVNGGSSAPSGDYYSPTEGSSSSSYPSTGQAYVPRPKNYMGSHLPDREVTQMTGLVSMIMLGATVLMAIGSVLAGGVGGKL
ncbi:MAG: zinc-ribbon domain-containing protein [Bdellovibrionales bacterium]|nr:zinc-ribbon domain-containing protein [Bdellovibrionales bacterium]